MNIPEQPKLDEIVKKLAEILRIQDWDIDVHVLSGYEMAKHEPNDDSTVRGLAIRDIRINKAEIYLNWENMLDWYQTLVHEMIHVQTTMMCITATAYFTENHSYFNDIYESMVDKQAVMFVKLYPVTNFTL